MGPPPQIALSFTSNIATAHRLLQDRSLVLRADDLGATAEAELAAGIEPEALLRALVMAGVGLSRFEVVDPSLESIFIAKVGPEARIA